MTFLYGALGARPVRFTAQGQEHAKMVARMFPGALNVGTYIDATWDVAELVAAELGVPSPSMPQLGPAHLAGLDYASWEALGLTTKLREYQREGALFLAVRSSAYLADQMRLGKTRTLVAGAVLSGARRVLILAPAMVRRVWPREILGLTGCQTVVCMGRAGSYGRLTCSCLGTPAAASCPVCKGRGFTKLEGAAFDKAFAEARFVLSSFDILMPQMRRTKEGGMNAQAHLPGFSARLAAERWGAVVMDECLTASTEVETLKGNKPIKNVAVGDFVRSFDPTTGGFVFKRVSATFRYSAVDRPIVRLSLSNGKVITATGNHPVLERLAPNKTAWVECSRLRPGAVLVRSNYAEKLWSLSERIRAYPGPSVPVVSWETIDSVVLSSMSVGVQTEGDGNSLGGHRPNNDLHCLREDVPRDRQKNAGCAKPNQADREASGLFLLARMPENLQGGADHTDDARSSSAANDQRQPYEESRESGRGTTGASIERAQASCARRERKADFACADCVGGRAPSQRCDCRDREDVQNRRCFDSEESSDALQGRYRPSDIQAGHRSGWAFSRFAESPSRRRSEDPVVDEVWVVRVEVFERPSSDELGELCPDGFVYDLEVEDLHNFCAEGVVVHNSHRVRGFNTSDAKKGRTRREYLTRVADQADRVWLASGTPIAARIRDLWAQLDIMTKGASSGNWMRTPFSWDAAYCEGQHNELGFWQAKGVSPRALVELPRRLKHLMLRREKKDVFTQLPARTEEVLKLPADAKSAKASRRLLLGLGSKQEKLKRALSATTDAKTDAVAELAAEQASAGEKVIVFVYNIDTPAKVAKAVRDLTKAAPVKIWTVSGEMPVDERILAGEDFVAHKSGGVFIATMDSTSEGVSLKGASTVYFLALHEVPATLAQAADRPWDPNTAAYTVVYVTMEGAVDDLYLKRLRPKLAALEVVGDTSLTQLRANIESEDMMTSGPQFDNLLDDMIAAVREEQARDLDAELRELGVDL